MARLVSDGRAVRRLRLARRQPQRVLQHSRGCCNLVYISFCHKHLPGCTLQCLEPVLCSALAWLFLSSSCLSAGNMQYRYWWGEPPA